MDFPGKILLFGEYGILLNSMALSVPFYRFSGRFSFADDSDSFLSENVAFPINELKRLYNFLKSGMEQFDFLNLENFRNDLERGLFFESSIPFGSGLGSSGALTAAVYAGYVINADAFGLTETREHLSRIESCFHGVSSGIDPLTSYLKKPVLFEPPTKKIKTADLSPFLESHTLFLIQTHHNGKTGELVSHFLGKCDDPDYLDQMNAAYIPLIAQTIWAIVSGDDATFELLMKRYSRFQLSFFEKMIPVTMKKHMEYGIETGDFYLKLCGSGGGGYMLAITRNSSKTQNYFKQNQLDYIIVNPIEIQTSNFQLFNHYTNI